MTERRFETPEQKADRLAKQRVYSANFRARNPGYGKEARDRGLPKKYGITAEDRDRMMVEQDARCAICKEVLFSPNIDHCHTTGKVRGLLCQHCNSGLGMFFDQPGVLREAALYLEK